MNRLCRWILLTALLMAAGIASGFNTKEVLAAEKYYDIGMNDSVHIHIDSGDTREYSYIRFSPKKDGAITFSYTAEEDYQFLTMRLMRKKNGNLKAFPSYHNNDDFILNGVNGKSKYTVTYGVKKGEKYVLRVYGEKDYTLYSKFKSVGDTGGKKKASAKTIKKGKTQYGMVPMTGKNQSRWYKFRVPKTKKVTVQFKGWGNSILFYQIIANGKVVVDRGIHHNNWDHKQGNENKEFNNKPKKMSAFLKKGSVIYIRVYSSHKGDSGYYYVKWN